MTLMMMSLTRATNSGEEGSIHRVGGDEGRELGMAISDPHPKIMVLGG